MEVFQLFERMLIKSKLFSYELSFGDVLARQVGENELFIVDSNVIDLHRSLIETISARSIVLSIEALEASKEFASIAPLIERMKAAGVDRNTTLVAVGGGVVQDVVGFISSIIFRGIDWNFIPTTLLAQSDSCIGSKTSINCNGVKNLIGGFYPPKNIIIDPTFLNTLSDKDFNSGIGEIIKIHLIKGEIYFRELVALIDELKKRDESITVECIKRSLLYKKSYVELDEFDVGPRNILNLGHSFGHGIEVASDYLVPHGIAVLMGIGMAFSIAEEKGLVDSQYCELVKNVGRRVMADIPGFDDTFDVDLEKFCQAISRDKKNSGGNVALIIPKKDRQMHKVFFEKSEVFDFIHRYLDLGRSNLVFN